MMPIVSYCKKCKEEVPPAEVCTLCGRSLPASSMRLSWAYTYAPVMDWIRWSMILRIMLPVLLVLIGLILGLEALLHGTIGVQALWAQGLMRVILWITAAMGAGVFFVLLLQGKEEIRFVIDQKGVHAKTYLLRPSAIKYWLRMQPVPAWLNSGKEPLPVGEKDVAWQELRRVQGWPDKEIILLYAPRWWLSMALYCLPGTYEEAVQFIYDHVKKRSQVKMAVPPQLPEEPPFPLT